MIKNLIGYKFGRLIVTKDSGSRYPDGSVAWLCICECGKEQIASSGNLKHGHVMSCGCLKKEYDIKRKLAPRKKPKKCSINSCNNSTRKGNHNFCGMHYARFKRYGNTEYITPESIRREHSRLANLRPAKPTTYKKLFGRHEHRVIIEQFIGKKLSSKECVHHIDGNKHNNSIGNLQVMSKAEHTRLHTIDWWSKNVRS